MLVRLLLLVGLLLGSPCLAQPPPDPNAPLPETQEVVKDLFNDEARLYFALPDNFLVFVDPASGTRQTIVLGANERNDLLTAYMKACDQAHRAKEGEQDPGTSITLGDRLVTFKTARRDSRSWVVVYVSGPAQEEKTRFAVPQVWDLKDPKMTELYGIKSGFERLLIKSAL
jgi:hypothetical protein